MTTKPTSPPAPVSAPGLPGRPAGSPNTATFVKIAQLVRWKMAGVTQVRMAEVLGMTPEGVRHIMQSPEYIEYEAAYMNGHISKMDEALAGQIGLIRAAFRPAIPLAMRTLVEAAMQRRDLPTALAAAKEILKRDPDRTLAEQDGEQAAPGIPVEVLDAAVAQNNDIAKSLQNDTTKVN